MKKFLISLLVFLLLAPVFSGRVLAEVIPQKVDYVLPYPGILPDNPAYFLKVFRDKIMSWVLFNSSERAFYFLLLSDKRLAAGQVLVNTGKVDLGVVTFASSQDYFRQAINLARQDNKDLVSKLVVAGSKHAEVLNLAKEKVGNRNYEIWKKAVDSNVQSQSRVMELYLSK